MEMLRTAPLVSQVAKPSGWFLRISIRVLIRRPWMSAATSSLSSIQERITSPVTRTRNSVPGLVLVLDELTGVIFRGVDPVQAGKAGHVPAPAAIDQRDERRADGKRGRGKEVLARQPHRLVAELIVHLGQIFMGAGDARHRSAGRHDDGAVLDVDCPRAVEIHRLPAVQALAVEEDERLRTCRRVGCCRSDRPRPA